MGEDTLQAVGKLKGISIGKSTSENIKLHGFPNGTLATGHWVIYGSDSEKIQDLIKKDPALSEKLHKQHPNTHAEVVWMVRNEMAMKVEDVLARRMRILFLDARAAMEMAPVVARIMKTELGLTEDWEKNQVATFIILAKKYLLTS